MKFVIRLFAVLHACVAVLFGVAAMSLVVAAARTGWEAAAQGLTPDAANAIIEAVGLLAAAVVALQIAQTIAEEEVVRDVHVSAPTRVRRFLSRFFVVVVVALAIEGLVATFKAVHEDMEQLRDAAALIAATAALLLGWGAFVFLNRSAEELEPEAMQEAKEEDEKLKM